MVDPPVSLFLLAWALVLGGGQLLMLRRVGLTAVHPIAYGALVVAAFGPLLGLGEGGAFSPLVMAVTGVSLVVVGVTDHRRLVRLLGPAAGSSSARNLSAHLGKLEVGRLVQVTKAFRGRTPMTTVAITAAGRAARARH